ncbi:NACHT nucleoside triphosphatase [Apiospora arundinis]|uniref:Fungal N-terminal domain-containing protein n=1 Tax=Apiospora arundinis TaxID=335852 RepID=A0ABR2JLZ1_9PEZI
MADPLSVAGLVAGLVSLGIQATTGITSYLGAIRNRKDELVAAKRYVDSITGNIQAFNNIQPRLRKHANLSSNVEALLQSCHNEAGSLQNLVHELSTPGVPSRKLKDKFQEKKKDFTYVFHRPDIARIEEKLSRFDGSLQSAIQLLLLDIQILAVEKIDKVQSGSQEMITISQRIDTGVSVIMPEIASLQQPLHAISQSVSSAAAVCSHGQSQIMGAKYSGAVNQNVSLVDDIAQALGVVQNSRFDRLEDMLSRLLSDEQHLSKGQLPDGVDTNRIRKSSSTATTVVSQRIERDHRRLVFNLRARNLPVIGISGQSNLSLQ